MNILIVTPYFRPQTGGIVTAVEMLSERFASHGHRIVVLVPGETNRVVPRSDDASAHGIYLRVPFIQGALCRGLLSFLIFLPWTLFQLARFTTAKRIDAVHIQYPMPWMFYFALLRRISPWKLIVTLQGNDVHDLPLVGRSHRWLVKRLLKSADGVVAVSQSLLEEIRKIFPGLKFKSWVVPNGASAPSARAQSFTVNGGVPRDFILTVGHVIHRKGIDIILRALKLARERGAALNLVVVGDGPEQSKLSALAKNLGLAENVHFAGVQPHGRVLEYFTQCLFFVLASREEGLPLVIVEAMANNKAVIATRVDGVPEIVKDGWTGLLVEPEDPESLAAALVRLHADRELRETLARRGRELAIGQYTWDAIANRYLAILSA